VPCSSQLPDGEGTTALRSVSPMEAGGHDRSSRERLRFVNDQVDAIQFIGRSWLIDNSVPPLAREAPAGQAQLVAQTPLMLYILMRAH